MDTFCNKVNFKSLQIQLTKHSCAPHIKRQLKELYTEKTKKSYKQKSPHTENKVLVETKSTTVLSQLIPLWSNKIIKLKLFVGERLRESCNQKLLMFYSSHPCTGRK